MHCRGRHYKRFTQDIKEFNVVVFVPNPLFGGREYQKPLTTWLSNVRHVWNTSNHWYQHHFPTINDWLISTLWWTIIIIILVVDYYSRYPEVVKLPTTTPRTIIGVLKRIFSRHGVPETLVSDNEPQYSSREFQDFASSYQFCHLTSSPHYAQSNGHAERAVQTVNKLLREREDPNMALLTYRSTPFPWWRIRANMPLQKNLLIPDWKYLNQFHKRNQEIKDRQKNDFDCRNRTQSLSSCYKCSCYL